MRFPIVTLATIIHTELTGAVCLGIALPIRVVLMLIARKPIPSGVVGARTGMAACLWHWAPFGSSSQRGQSEAEMKPRRRLFRLARDAQPRSMFAGDLTAEHRLGTQAQIRTEDQWQLWAGKPDRPVGERGEQTGR